MRTDGENDGQELSPLLSEAHSDSELKSQEVSEPANDIEEEQFFWSEPGVCG